MSTRGCVIALLVVAFVAGLDHTIVAAAGVRIGLLLDDPAGQGWITTAFLISSTVAGPLFGGLSDQFGRKNPFLAALALFVAGSALCSAAGSLPWLAVCRAVQGLGAGGMLALISVLLADLVPARERPRYGARFLTVFALATLLGPPIGGLFADRAELLGLAGWRWAFLVNVPL
ncbi:MFS transporter, partial [Actinocorallia lasiicapitis]